MTDNRQMHDHDEIDLLLPWYVNDTLDPTEHDRVANHVATCKECQENVSLLADVQAAVVRNEATPLVPQPRLNELLDAINLQDQSRQRDRSPSTIYFAAAAATVLLIATLMLTNPDDTAGVVQEYETATTTQNGASMDYVLSIQFASDSSPTDRDRVLQDIGARDVSGGSDEGSYRVIVQLSTTSLEELDLYTSDLESLPEVTSVSVVALQLPMKTEQ
jgi:hypothetical protein